MANNVLYPSVILVHKCIKDKALALELFCIMFGGFSPSSLQVKVGNGRQSLMMKQLLVKGVLLVL